MSAPSASIPPPRPDDVGKTVTLRVVAGGVPAEVVGRLVSVAEGEIVVRRRDGTDQRIPVADIAVWRLVPPSPAEAIGVGELEHVLAQGWPGAEQQRLGEWVLRASAGPYRRSSSTVAAGDPGLPPADAVETVTRFYRDRGLRPVLVVPDVPASTELHAVLAGAGWTPWMRLHRLTAELAHVLRAAGENSVQVDLVDAPDEHWQRVARPDADPVPPDLLRGVEPLAFATVRDAETGSVTATARVAVTGRWAGLGLVAVTASHRRTGLATAVSAAALRWAGQRGARHLVLDVMAGNEPALALWDRLGLRPHHDAVYYVPDQPIVR